LEVEVIPLVGPPRRLRLEVGLSETVGGLLERVVQILGVSGGFFRLVSDGKVLEDSMRLEEAIREGDSKFFLYPEVMGG